MSPFGKNYKCSIMPRVCPTLKAWGKWGFESGICNYCCKMKASIKNRDMYYCKKHSTQVSNFIKFNEMVLKSKIFYSSSNTLKGPYAWLVLTYKHASTPKRATSLKTTGYLCIYFMKTLPHLLNQPLAWAPLLHLSVALE